MPNKEDKSTYQTESSHSDLEFVRSFIPVGLKEINFTREKRVSRDIFGKKSRMEVVFLIYCEHLSFCVQLSPQIQTHSSCFVRTLA